MKRAVRYVVNRKLKIINTDLSRLVSLLKFRRYVQLLKIWRIIISSVRSDEWLQQSCGTTISIDCTLCIHPILELEQQSRAKQTKANSDIRSSTVPEVIPCPVSVKTATLCSSATYYGLLAVEAIGSKAEDTAHSWIWKDYKWSESLRIFKSVFAKRILLDKM